MKICHLTSVHSYTDTRIFIKECVSLAQAGYEVHLVAPNAPTSIEQGVYIHGIAKESGNRLTRMTKTVNNVFKKGLEIDANVYHFHDPELIPVALKLKKLGKKVIYDVHEDLPRQIYTKNWIPKITQKIVSKTIEKYENKSSQKFDVIITATSFIKNRFSNKHKNVEVINNYPLLNELKVEDVCWSEKENTVCYIGGITFNRGIKEMIQALEITNIETFLLAGKFSVSSEKEEVKKMKGWKKVQELGFLDRKNIKDTYKRSKAGLVTLRPSINYIDSMPVKMFEYMAAGIPVIASNFPLWEGIIVKSNSGICVNPLSPEEIAEAIEWIIENPIEAEKMGKNGREAVEREYNWEQESMKLIKIYENL